MKRHILLLAALVFSAVTALAQTLQVWQDDIRTSWIYDANQLTAPNLFDATGITIGDHHHAAPFIGMWLTVSDETCPADVVRIDYGESAGNAIVSAPGDLIDYLTIRNNGFDVDVTVADALERELTFDLTGGAGSATFALHGNYKTTVKLDGVNLNATESPEAAEQPALWIDNGKRISIVVTDGTYNTIADAPTNTRKSAFYVKGHAEWKGDGAVSISGRARHAYSSNEYTLLKSSFTGSISVEQAESDGLHVEQYLQVNSGIINVRGTKGDAIDVAYVLEDDDVTPTADEHNGEFIMKGGEIIVTVDAADTKGVKCEADMTITAGTIRATATGDGSRGVSAGRDLYLGSEDAASDTEAYVWLTASGDEYIDIATGDSSKCRGLKVKGDFYHYRSTLERDANSVITKKKIVDVDGTYHALGGTLTNIVIE